MGQAGEVGAGGAPGAETHVTVLSTCALQRRTAAELPIASRRFDWRHRRRDRIRADIMLLITLIVGLSYLLGALTGPVLAKMGRRLWRRLRGAPRDRWRGYFDQ
jgi:hypothetical protein